MTRFNLILAAADNPSSAEAASSFYWSNYRANSSFLTNLDPWLTQLGPVRSQNLDMVRIAVAALAADRSVLRAGGGSNWNERHLELHLPVSAPDAWGSVAPQLEQVLGFLSGDKWSLTFSQQEPGPRAAPAPETAPRRVVLLSGGADSAIGALRSRTLLADGEHHVLLSHFSNTMLPQVQRHVASEALRLVPSGSQEHLIFRVARRRLRADGKPYPSEPSTRSRSLLFLALGLAVASLHRVPLWIPENGFASINPPLGSERLGSLSTRTTHPAFLEGLSAVLTSVGAHAEIENPFALLSKGEMFQSVKNLVGSTQASGFLSATHSCGLTGQTTHGFSPIRQCGVCFGCVLRRSSFTSSEIQDRTDYIAPSEIPAVQRWLKKKSVEQPVRNLIQRGIGNRDLIALNLPDAYPLRDARELCARGIQDLRSLYL